MKYLILILSTTILFSAELEVDGNLKVTGTVESTTIDSLKQVIAELQAQLAALQGQGGWETRSFDYDFNWEYQNTNPNVFISDITGYDLDYGIVQFISLKNQVYGGSIGTGGGIHIQINSVGREGDLEGHYTQTRIHGHSHQWSFYGLNQSVVFSPPIEHALPEGPPYIQIDCDAYSYHYPLQPGDSYSATLTLLITAQFPN